MQAIIVHNGKQYHLEEGRYLEMDLLPNAPDETIEFDRILMVMDGETTHLGLPALEGARIKAKVLSHSRKAKVLVYKMRCKKGYRRKNGHRQGFSKVQVLEFSLPGKKA